MGVRLYPPLLEGTLPAFYLDPDSSENNEGCGILRIPFSYNRAVSASDVGTSAKVKFKTVQNDVILGEAIGNLKFDEQVIEIPIKKYKNVVNNIETDEPIEFKIGNYYKVQAAFISKDDISGYYSTVGVIKCTAKPIVEIDQLSLNTINSNPNYFTGKYSCPNDINEKVYSSYFTIINASGEIIFKSTETLSSYQNQDNDYVSISSFNYAKDLPKNEICTIFYTVKTVNGLEFSSPKYQIMQRKLIPMDFQGDLIATANTEDGFVDISIKGANINNMEEIVSGKFTLVREDSLYPGEWVEINRFKLNYEYPTKNIFRDFTVEHGKTYTYAIQQFNDHNVYSDRKISNSVYIEFEDMFLYDGEKQLKIRFNPQVSSFKLQVSESRNDTIGSKYPFFYRNSKIGYKTFPISGLISMQMDDNEFFLTYDEIAREDLQKHRHNSLRDRYENPDAYKHTDLLTQNFMSERLFKMKVLEWLNDGHVKLFKSPGEGNYLVRLMETSLSPNTTLGRMLHTFNSTAYECADIDYSNLVKYQIIPDTLKLNVDLNPFLQWQEDTFYEISFERIGEDENGNSKYSDYSTNLLERDGKIQPTDIIRLMDLFPGTKVVLVFDESGGRNVDEQRIVTWSPLTKTVEVDGEPQNVNITDKVEIIIGSTGNYFADNVRPIYGIYIYNNNSNQEYYQSNNIHISYTVEGTVNTNFGLIKEIQPSDNNFMQFIGSNRYKLIKDNSSFKDSIPYINFVNLYKRPVEYLYYKPEDKEIIEKYSSNWNIFKEWHAANEDLFFYYPNHFIYNKDGYRELSEIFEDDEKISLYWDVECTDLFSDEESQEYSPFSIYVIRPAQFNGVNVLDHLVNAASIIDRIDGHQDNHWFEEYYIDRLAKAYSAEDYLAYCTAAINYYEDNYLKRNYISNGNFEDGVTPDENKNSNGEIIEGLKKNIWKISSPTGWNSDRQYGNYKFYGKFNVGEEAANICKLEKIYKSSNLDDEFVSKLPILQKLETGDKLILSCNLKLNSSRDYKLIVNANIVADDQIYSIIENRELIKQGRWIYVESSLIYDNSWAWENASDLKLEINLELINNEEEILEEDVEISIQEIQLNLNPRQTYDDLDYHTAKEIMVLDAWTGELKTLENFKYNPSAFIEYINPGVDKTKNKIDLREIEYYSIPDFVPGEDIKDIQIGNGVYGDFCFHKNTLIYNLEEDIDEWRIAKDLRKIDLNLWRFNEDENPYWEKGKQISKDNAKNDLEIRTRLNGYLDNSGDSLVWKDSISYWNSPKINENKQIQEGNGVNDGEYFNQVLIDWSFGKYKQILEAEDFSYQEYNRLLEEEIDSLVNPKVLDPIYTSKGGGQNDKL